MNLNFAGNVGTGGAPVIGGSTEVSHPEARAPPDPLLKDTEVCAQLNCARSTLWRYVANGDFPRPLKIGGISRWRQSTVNQRLASAETEAAA